MTEQLLFNVEEVKKEKPPPNMRCRNCIHCYEHQYNTTKYCNKQKGKGTAYGHKKIKANDYACLMFETENKPA